MKNIVLIGMPGCGKSTVGRQVAKTLGYTVYDTDKMIEQAAGMPISGIFEELGESAFRDMESAAARKVAAENHAVISCGGGMVLREENMTHLRRNGIIFFLDRPLSAIARADLSDRPLVQNELERLEALYEQRVALYRSYAMHIIDNDASVAEVAAELVARYRKEQEDESTHFEWPESESTR